MNNCTAHKKVKAENCCSICLIEERDKLQKALREIMLTQPIYCDGNHQGDYACDLHREIAKEALNE